MGTINALLRRIPFADAVWSFGSRIGLWALLWNILGVVGAAAMTAWAYLWSHLPPWGLALVFIGALALLLFCVDKGMSAWRSYVVARAMMKFDPAQYQQFGRELVELSQEIFRFLTERQRDQADRHRANPADGTRMADWQADRDFESVTGKLFFEKFGTQVLGAVAMLNKIGIRMPPHMVQSAHYRPNGLPQFMGMIGDLLARGNIDDAVSASSDRDLMWQIQH